MADETRLSTGALAETIELYLKLLGEATTIEVELKEKPGRRELEREKLEAIKDSLIKASGALATGCEQGVYGLFLIK
jgi:hypothetical protein